jgi:glutamate racemase
MGISMLPVINAIEKGASAKSIVNKFKLTSLICEHLGVDGLVLGCTHLPFLQSELEKIANIPIIDPAEHMLEYIMSSTHK